MSLVYQQLCASCKGSIKTRNCVCTARRVGQLAKCLGSHHKQTNGFDSCYLGILRLQLAQKFGAYPVIEWRLSSEFHSRQSHEIAAGLQLYYIEIQEHFRLEASYEQGLHTLQHLVSRIQKNITVTLQIITIIMNRLMQISTTDIVKDNSNKSMEVSHHCDNHLLSLS